VSDFIRLVVPTVVIPLAVFSGNWIIRHRFECAQSAAGDFILGVLVFDGCVVSGSETFAPFVRNVELRAAVTNVHIALFVLGLVAWALIVRYGEPHVIAANEAGGFNLTSSVAMVCCWVGAFALVAVHIAYYVVR
jgi:hypothetical protein